MTFLAALLLRFIELSHICIFVGDHLKRRVLCRAFFKSTNHLFLSKSLADIEGIPKFIGRRATCNWEDTVSIKEFVIIFSPSFLDVVLNFRNQSTLELSVYSIIKNVELYCTPWLFNVGQKKILLDPLLILKSKKIDSMFKKRYKVTMTS